MARSPLERREGRAGYVLIAPTTILLVVFYLFPLAQTVFYSFTDWNPGTGTVGSIVGAQNFVEVLTNAEFLRAAGNTGLYVIVVVPCSLALGLFFTAMLATPFRGRGIYRTLMFTPYIAPIVGSALIFSYLLTPLGGLVNNGLGLLGLPSIAFLTTEPWAMVSVIIFSIWQLVGYTMIIYSAALSNVPASYYEAATIDGAGRYKQFFRITLPLLRYTIITSTVLMLVGSFTTFDTILILTGGGPGTATRIAPLYMYITGFSGFEFGYASAISVLLLLLGAGLSLVVTRATGFRTMQSQQEGA